MGKLLNAIAGIGMTFAGMIGGYEARPMVDDYISNLNAPPAVKEYPTGFDSASVKKYGKPNSKYTLVHVRQTHDVPETRFIIDNSTKMEILSCQNEIIDLFREIEGVEDVLVEGNSDVINGEKNYLDRMKMFNKCGVSFASDEEIARLQRRYVKLMEQTNGRKLKSYGKMSATDVLGYNGEINRHDAEDIELNRLRGKEIDESGTLGKYNEMAEDYAVSLVPKHAKSGNGNTVYMVYGKDHSFKNNVNNWNNDNPDERISLIEVTPKVIE